MFRSECNFEPGEMRILTEEECLEANGGWIVLLPIAVIAILAIDNSVSNSSSGSTSTVTGKRSGVGSSWTGVSAGQSSYYGKRQHISETML